MASYRQLMRRGRDDAWYLVNPTNLFEALRIGWLLWRHPDRIAGLIAPKNNFVVERIHTQPTRSERMRAAGFKRRNTHLPSDE